MTRMGDDLQFAASEPRTYGPNPCASLPASRPPRKQRRTPAQPQQPALADRPESSTIIHGAPEIDKSYLPERNVSATSDSSPSALSNGDKTVTVTLGTITEDTPVTGKDVVSTIITPARSLKDPAANAAATTRRSMKTLF